MRRCSGTGFAKDHAGRQLSTVACGGPGPVKADPWEPNWARKVRTIDRPCWTYVSVHTETGTLPVAMLIVPSGATHTLILPLTIRLPHVNIRAMWRVHSKTS